MFKLVEISKSKGSSIIKPFSRFNLGNSAINSPSCQRMSKSTLSFDLKPADLSPKPAKKIRHMLSLEDYSPKEIFALVEKAALFKKISKTPPESLTTHEKDFKNSLKTHDSLPILSGKTLALIFKKRSTRTRVATETSMAYLGGHSMFLGSQDIQLGVNESLLDTSKVISSMVDGIMARVDGHSEIEELAKYSQVPVINALSDSSHPTQILADMLTLHEVFGKPGQSVEESLHGLQTTYIGDANNMLYEFLLAFPKCGLKLAISTPKTAPVPENLLSKAHADNSASVTLHTSPQAAIKDTNAIITDTWISMGQEAEKIQKLIDFEGFNINSHMIAGGNPSNNWVFMHCLPRKQEEVTDQVFYSDKSVVFQEAENRKWTIMSTIHTLLA
ncbi:Ornithine carbamoyltransferase, mitochondrial [Smittium culicis]|uniref:ornithine carbamoyltransferase n=2 Tax=Smittium culicis TaxID=133412 RepID=A0A1R1X5Z0_9FUNG|nr:Ornithine carbamoyltransferase, mitochondrial [Smittium culicis]